VLGLLGQLCLPVELVASNIQLHPVVTQHLLLVPHSHAVLELKVEGLQEFEVHPYPLFCGQLVELTGRSHTNPAIAYCVHGILLLYH